MADSYPDNNPKTAFGAAKLPLEVVPPALMHYAAMAFADGARKYGPYNWREKKISASVYYGAALRHLMAWWDRDERASDSNVPHLAHAIACLAMIADVGGTELFNDNRPLKGVAMKLQQEWINGEYARRPSEGEGQGTPGPVQADGVSPLAGAERDGQTVPRLQRVRVGRTLRRRNKSRR